ncbi:MAG: head-tail connector protein [Methanobrevibacter sp.]|nr:head-tail connector protein [Methanobrevibacter sp.]
MPSTHICKYTTTNMKYLTLEEIKKQCTIDPQFDEDNEFLTMLGDSAEDMTEQLLDCSLDELASEKGGIPATIRHAMRILVDYFYSVNRGSSENAPDIPSAVTLMLKLYRNYN